MSVPLIWFKGHIVPSEEALVPVLSPTAQFGLNVFEGIVVIPINLVSCIYLGCMITCVG